MMSSRSLSWRRRATTSSGSGIVSIWTPLTRTQKIELQNRVALLEQRLAEPVSQMRFIQAVEGALTLRKAAKEMDELRAENAELKRRVQQLESVAHSSQ